VDRYLSAYMADKIGATFAARISGVARFGLFVTLLDSGANGLLPFHLCPTIIGCTTKPPDAEWQTHAAVVPADARNRRAPA